MRTAKIGPDLRLASSWPKKTFLTFSTFPQLLEEAVSRDLEKFKQWYTANTRRSTDGRIGEPSVHTWGPLGDRRKWPLRSGRYGQVGV